MTHTNAAVKTGLGLLVAFAIGIVCRLTDVPLPAPLALIGALLVSAMTAGYVVTDRFMTRHTGEPTGETVAPRDRAP